MTNKIILKKSSVASRAPAPEDLVYGELAINYADGALYYKRADNTIQNLLTGTGGGGGGGVSSVAISVPTGLSVSGSPITSSGIINITLESGYSIPSTAAQTNWSTAYGWGNHASAGYQTGLVSGTNIKTINGNSLLGTGGISIAEMLYPVANTSWIQRTSAGTKYWDRICSSITGTILYSTVYTGSSFNIWKSTDSGNSWSQLTGAGTRGWSNIECSGDGSTVAATTDTGQVWVSTDAGITWANASAPSDGYEDVAIAKGISYGNNIVAVASQVYTSTNSGATWTTRTPASPYLNYTSVCTDYTGSKIAVAANNVWAGSNLIANGYIYTSTDGGVNWAPATDAGLRLWREIVCDSTGNIIAALDVTGGVASVYISTNGGATWSLSKTISTGTASINITMSNDGKKVLVLPSTNQVYQSNDSGSTWQTIVPSYNVAVDTNFVSSDIVISGDGSTVSVAVTNGYVISNVTNLSIPVTDGKSWLSSVSTSYFQQALVSGSNIKTINGTSILGSGDISVGLGTVTNVVGTGTVSGLTISGNILTSGSITLGGTLTLTSDNITSGLGYTPYNATNPSGYVTSTFVSSNYQPLDTDLTAIAALTGTSGFLKTNGTGTWTVDASTYLTTTAASSTYLTSATAATTYQPLSTNLTGWSAISTASKQDTLVSGTNIKTINGASILGTGDITISGGGGTGTVTSVGISVPTGLSVANTPITTSGTIAITLTTGYSIPTIANQTDWSTAYSWGNHASAGYQVALVSGTNIKTINGASILGSGDITISGGGGGGGTGITNTVVTATTQAASTNTRYILTAATTTTLTLPATPTQGDTVYVVIANNLSTNVIARNSQNIMGLAEDLTIDNPVASFGLIYINSTLGWRFL